MTKVHTDQGRMSLDAKEEMHCKSVSATVVIAVLLYTAGHQGSIISLWQLSFMCQVYNSCTSKHAAFASSQNIP